MTKPDTLAVEQSDALKPCRECGEPCRVEIFDGSHVKATVWICSNHTFFGGDCPSTTAYLFEHTWNARFERDHLAPTDGLVGELERLSKARGQFIIDLNYDAEEAIDEQISDIVCDNLPTILAALRSQPLAALSRPSETAVDVREAAIAAIMDRVIGCCNPSRRDAEELLRDLRAHP